jgi:hypothetical protein
MEKPYIRTSLDLNSNTCILGSDEGFKGTEISGGGDKLL